MKDHDPYRHSVTPFPHLSRFVGKYQSSNCCDNLTSSLSSESAYDLYLDAGLCKNGTVLPLVPSQSIQINSEAWLNPPSSMIAQFQTQIVGSNTILRFSQNCPGTIALIFIIMNHLRFSRNGSTTHFPENTLCSWPSQVVFSMFSSIFADELALGYDNGNSRRWLGKPINPASNPTVWPETAYYSVGLETSKHYSVRIFGALPQMTSSLGPLEAGLTRLVNCLTYG